MLEVGRCSFPPTASAWAALLAELSPQLLFSSFDYVSALGQIDILYVRNSGRPVALFPIPVSLVGGQRQIIRTNYLSPYFPVLFANEGGATVIAEQSRRKALRSLIGFIQSNYSAMILPLHPDHGDMAPWRESHCELEHRTTYELPLGSLDQLWAGFSGKIRNHIAKASSLKITVEQDLYGFDFAAALFYEDEEAKLAWQTLARKLTETKKATSLIAWTAAGEPVGGMFLGLDNLRGYNLLSYFDRTAGQRGIPATLIWHAARHCAELGKTSLDLEGSVLPGIERFYQQFGGLRRSYFQVRWQLDVAAHRPFLYHYDEEEE